MFMLRRYSALAQTLDETTEQLKQAVRIPKLYQNSIWVQPKNGGYRIEYIVAKDGIWFVSHYIHIT